MVTAMQKSNQPATLLTKIQDLEAGENLIPSPHRKKLCILGPAHMPPETFYKLPITELEYPKCMYHV